jgi:outer membrane receptor protein involved in Fe transport
MSTLRGKLIPALTALLGVIVAAPAPAQSNELSEIVVTARKRDESPQSAPVSTSIRCANYSGMPWVK